MTDITDDEMRERLGQSRDYTVVLLRVAPSADLSQSRPLIWEHGRRNFQLRADGLLAIVCPIRDGSGVNGIGIFNASLEDAKSIMDGDPGVQAGLFTYDLHACRSFPGDALP